MFAPSSVYSLLPPCWYPRLPSCICVFHVTAMHALKSRALRVGVKTLLNTILDIYIYILIMTVNRRFGNEKGIEVETSFFSISLAHLCDTPTSKFVIWQMVTRLRMCFVITHITYFIQRSFALQLPSPFLWNCLRLLS